MIKVDDCLINPAFIVSIRADHERQVIEIRLSDGKEIRVRSHYRGTLTQRFEEIEQAIETERKEGLGDG